MIGGHMLKGWAETQPRVASSSGESELYSTLRAASAGLGIQSIACSLRIYIRGKVVADESVALGIRKRRGLGKTRHIDIGHLWAQQTAAEKRL